MQVRARLRQVKRFKDDMRKLSVVSERFALKVPCDELIILKQIVGKLLEHNPDAREELPQLF